MSSKRESDMDLILVERKKILIFFVLVISQFPHNFVIFLLCFDLFFLILIIFLSVISQF